MALDINYMNQKLILSTFVETINNFKQILDYQFNYCFMVSESKKPHQDHNFWHILALLR